MKNAVIHILVFALISLIFLSSLNNKLETLNYLKDIYESTQAEGHYVAYISYKINLNSLYFGYFCIAIIVDLLISLILANQVKFKISIFIVIIIDTTISIIAYKYVQQNSTNIQYENNFQNLLYMIGAIIGISFMIIDYIKVAQIRKLKKSG